MSHKSIEKVAIVVPNFNGQEYLAAAIDSLLDQTLSATVIVVENGSEDNSDDVLASYGNRIVVIKK